MNNMDTINLQHEKEKEKSYTYKDSEAQQFYPNTNLHRAQIEAVIDLPTAVMHKL